MTDFHDIYKTMTSFEYRMKQARERTNRIGLVVADEQFKATALIPKTSGRGNHARNRLMAFWADEIRARVPSRGD